MQLSMTAWGCTGGDTSYRILTLRTPRLPLFSLSLSLSLSLSRSADDARTKHCRDNDPSHLTERARIGIGTLRDALSPRDLRLAARADRHRCAETRFDVAPLIE